MKHLCQNCDKTWNDDEVEDFPEQHIHERVAPGEPMPSGECPDCGAACHPVKVKFNHAFHVAFEVISEEEDPEKITEKEILAGFVNRLHGFLLNENDVMEACEQYDLYECQHQCKDCGKKLSAKDVQNSHIHKEKLVCKDCWPKWSKIK